MRVFVYEYTCAAAPSDMPSSLAAEGRAMLTAVFADFAALDGVEPVTLLRPELPWAMPGAVRLDDPTREEAVFLDLARSADWALVIAPEFNDLLVTRTQWVAEAGCRHLSPAVSGVWLAADKLLLAAVLRDRGVPVPATSEPDDAGAAAIGFPAVLKPVHGAGSLGVRLVRDAADLRASLAVARADSPPDRFLLQRHVLGTAASVSFLLGAGGDCVRLMPAAQHLSDDGHFRYLGGRLPLPLKLRARALALGERAVRAVPGLIGYVGVDLVLGAAADGSEDYVIEINPRLTTSYLGLRALCGANLTRVMLDVAAGGRGGDLKWLPGAVEFQPDGAVIYLPDSVAAAPPPGDNA